MDWCKNCGNYATDNCGNCISSVDPRLNPSRFVLNEIPKDMVNHPDHYKTSSSGLETIDVIKAFTENCVGIEAVCTANVIKYVCRWKKKNGLEDLKKAEWYLNYLIRNMELKESNKEKENK